MHYFSHTFVWASKSSYLVGHCLIIIASVGVLLSLSLILAQTLMLCYILRLKERGLCDIILDVIMLLC